jgi:hypothetical protein
MGIVLTFLGGWLDGRFKRVVRDKRSGKLAFMYVLGLVG